MITEKKMRKELKNAAEGCACEVRRLQSLNRSTEIVQDEIEMLNAIVKVHNYYSEQDKYITSIDILDTTF